MDTEIRRRHAVTRRQLLTSIGGASMALVISGTRTVGAQENSESAPLVVTSEAVLSVAESGSEPVRILDASPLRTYRSKHIEGAIHTFWEDTVDRNYPVFGAVITQGFEQQQRLEYISRIGASADETIVVYDDAGGFRAARIVWFLRFLGFPKTALLDGGLRSWENAGGATASGVARWEQDDPPRVDPQEGYYVVTEALFERLERRDTQIVDIRTAEERADTLGGQLPVGAIPGSLSWPWSSLIDPNAGALISTDQLAESARLAGITDDQDIVVYGRFGVETALSWLVLKHLRYSRVLTYDRGWVEWASTPALPIIEIPG